MNISPRLVPNQRVRAYLIEVGKVVSSAWVPIAALGPSYARGARYPQTEELNRRYLGVAIKTLKTGVQKHGDALAAYFDAAPTVANNFARSVSLMPDADKEALARALPPELATEIARGGHRFTDLTKNLYTFQRKADQSPEELLALLCRDPHTTESYLAAQSKQTELAAACELWQNDELVMPALAAELDRFKSLQIPDLGIAF